MKTIRKSLYETNSSSVHTICISEDENEYSPRKFNHVDLGSYGWGVYYLTRPQEKLDYLFTYAIVRMKDYDWDALTNFCKIYFPDRDPNKPCLIDELSEKFVEVLNEAIKDNSVNTVFKDFKEVTDLQVLINFVQIYSDDFSEFTVSIDEYNDFYIDHQSVEDGTVTEFYSKFGELRDIIFNSKYYISIDNDNRDRSLY